MSLLALVLLWGCEYIGNPPPPRDDVEDADCPPGFVEATNPYLVVEDLQVGGVVVSASFREDVTRNGQAAACIRETGTEVQFVLAVNGEGQGLLSVVSAEPGEADLSERAGLVRIQLSGPDFPDPVNVYTWDRGSVLYVDEVGNTFGFSVTNALGVDAAGNEVSLNVNGEARVR